MNTKSKKTQNERYRDLLKVTDKTLSYVNAAIYSLAEELEYYVALAEKVIDQTKRHIQEVPSKSLIGRCFHIKSEFRISKG